MTAGALASAPQPLETVPAAKPRLFGRPEGLAALSGLLLAASFPKYGHALVAWVALVPLLVALAETGGHRGHRLGYLAGAVSSLGIVYWTTLVVQQFGGLPLPAALGAMLALCATLALFPLLFGWMAGRWVKAFGPRALLAAPLAWVAMEILRAHTLWNFSWCLLGYSQASVLPVIQIARFGAVYAVSFVVVCVSAGIAVAVVDRGPHRFRPLLAVGALVAAVVAFGRWQLAQPWPEAGRVTVGLVQADIRQDEKWEPGKAWDHVNRHLDLTRVAVARGAKLVVWPESSLPGYYDRSSLLREVMQREARQDRIHLLFGNDDRDDGVGPDRKVWVGAKLLDPEGDLAYRYHKMRLVPFGEFVPMKPLITLGGRFAAKIVAEVADFTPGEEFAVASLGERRLAGFICYEAIFPDHVREFAIRGAELLVNMTNDAWYGRTSAPDQHFAQAVFRAVENERFLVRAANTGITAVVDPRGRVLERTQLFEPTVLVREVAYVGSRTPYTRYGDVFAWSCLLAALALTLRAQLSRR